MYYYWTASSVLKLLSSQSGFYIDDKNPLLSRAPSCPKSADIDHYCQNTFPECKGKTIACKQILLVKNKEGDPVYINFSYYIINQDGERDGRVRKENLGLRDLIAKYTLDTGELKEI
jgi:hypothetical protein